MSHGSSRKGVREHSARIEFSFQPTVALAVSSFLSAVTVKAMQLAKISVVVLALTTQTCGAGIVIANSNSEKSTSGLVEDLVNIVKSCYGDRIDGVGLGGDLPDTLARALTVQHSIPVVLIDNTTMPSDNPPPVPVQFRHKLHLFIVGASSWNQFTVIVQGNMKRSMWWNHMASFLIVDQSPGCEEAVQYLYLAWRYDVLNANVICGGYKRGRVIVNYNPFANRAPVPWEKINYPVEIPDHPFFTFFRRTYRRNVSICANFDFEKTKDVGGYKIRVDGVPLVDFNITLYGPTSYQFLITHERILHTVYSAMNATYKFSGIERPGLLIADDMRKVTMWIAKSVDSQDLITYPHAQTGVIIVSKFRGHKSQLNKILCVIDTYSRYGMGVVYLVTLVFLKFFVHQALVPALLNLVRITCNTGFTNIPNNTSPRIFLTGLLFFVVTMQGIYQGNLAALLTQQIPLRNVNRLKDLVDLGYEKIYGRRGFEDFMECQYLKERFILNMNIDNSISHVVHDPSAAQIEFAQGILDQARKFKLHVSTKYLETIYIAFEIRLNWPLEQRFNEILAKMVEADILDPWDVKCNPTKLDEFEFDDEVKKNVDFKNIELHELTFSFVILVIGLVCATIVFIVELAIHRYKSRIVNVRVQILS